MTEGFLTQAMDLYGDTIYRLALCRLQNTADAEDVYQDTFLRLCQQKRAELWENDRLKAWLIRVAINCCNDIGRQRRRKSLLKLEDLPELTCSGLDSGLEIWDAASRLPGKQRTIFHLYYGENYSSREIAGMLRMTETAVRVNLNRARAALRKELNSYG